MHAVAVAALTAFAVAGCGGSASGKVEPVPLQKSVGRVSRSPPPRTERSSARRVPRASCPPRRAAREYLESVTIFPLIKSYAQPCGRRRRRQLDGVAERLAKSLGGELRGTGNGAARRSSAGG